MSGFCLFTVGDHVSLLQGSRSVPAVVHRAEFDRAVFKTELRVGNRVLCGYVDVLRRDFAKRVRVLGIVRRSV